MIIYWLNKQVIFIEELTSIMVFMVNYPPVQTVFSFIVEEDHFVTSQNNVCRGGYIRLFWFDLVSLVTPIGFYIIFRKTNTLVMTI